MNGSIEKFQRTHRWRLESLQRVNRVCAIILITNQLAHSTNQKPVALVAVGELDNKHLLSPVCWAGPPQLVIQFE